MSRWQKTVKTDVSQTFHELDTIASFVVFALLCILVTVRMDLDVQWSEVQCYGVDCYYSYYFHRQRYRNCACILTDTVTWLLVWVSREKRKETEADLIPANLLSGWGGELQASQSFCPLSYDSALRHSFWKGGAFTLVQLVRSGTQHATRYHRKVRKKETEKYSRSLRLLGLSHVMLK